MALAWWANRTSVRHPSGSGSQLGSAEESGLLEPRGANATCYRSVLMCGIVAILRRTAEAVPVDSSVLLELLRSTQLVTVLGMGGVGKSRLAQAVAQNALDDFADGVWFVPLASIEAAEGAVERIALAIAGSIGFQIGGQSKDIILLFMTDEALEKFRAGKGWEAGVDGNVALISVGAGAQADTATLKNPIVGFVFDAKGLIADISLKGAKFSKIDKKE